MATEHGARACTGVGLVLILRRGDPMFEQSSFTIHREEQLQDMLAVFSTTTHPAIEKSKATASGSELRARADSAEVERSRPRSLAVSV